MESAHNISPSFKVGLVIILSLLTTACSSTGLFLLNSSLKVGSEHSVSKNIAYGDDAWQKLDVYSPNSLEAAESDKKPVLVFFYGGSWDSGNKEMYYFVANSFAKRGYVVVIPDYVKYPQGRFPAFMHDGAAALAWTHRSISKYGGNPDEIFVAGHSAGAHLGALLLADSSYLQPHDLTPRHFKGFAGLAGPYNFTPKSETLIDIFGPAESFSHMQVNTFVSGDEPDMLLLHGADDSTVGVLNQTSLQEELTKAGSPVESQVYDSTGHVGILMSLTPPLTGGTTALEDMDRFFQSRRQSTANQIQQTAY